jgi:hypothetical protein
VVHCAQRAGGAGRRRCRVEAAPRGAALRDEAPRLAPGAVVGVDRRVVDEVGGAEVLAGAHRYLAGLARAEPETAWLLVRLEPTHRVLGALRPHAARDVGRGLAAGRFAVADEAVALRAMGGALLGVLRGLLDGELGEDAPRAHAEGVLRALGVPPAEAAAVASRPLPKAGDAG